MRTTTRAWATAATVAGAAASLLTAASASAAPAIPLNPEQETSAVESEGSGFFAYTTSDTQLCYTLQVRRLTDDPVAAHIHLAPRNLAGGVVVPLATPPAATSSVSECLTAAEDGAMTPTELAAITADPRSYYVNVHTPQYPGGEIRGQLK